MIRAAAALAALLLALPARADDSPLEIPPLRCDLDGRAVELPAGVLLPAPAWARLDAEVRRLQEAEVRLAAENASLREAAGSAPLVVVAAALVVGLALGAAAVAAL